MPECNLEPWIPSSGFPVSLQSSLWFQRCFIPSMRNRGWENLIVLGWGLKQVFNLQIIWTWALLSFTWDKSIRRHLHLLTASSEYMCRHSFRGAVAREARYERRVGRQGAPLICKRERTFLWLFMFSVSEGKNSLLLLLDANDLFARKTTFLLQVYSSCSFIKENLFCPQNPKSFQVYKYLLNAFG